MYGASVPSGTPIRRPRVTIAPVAAASPACLAQHSAPQRPADLVRRAVVSMPGGDEIRDADKALTRVYPDAATGGEDTLVRALHAGDYRHFL